MPRQWVRSGEVVWEELDGEAVLVSSSTQRTWVLNRTASFVWRNCDGRASLEELAAELARAGGREVRRVKEEVAAFCKELAADGLLYRARHAKGTLAAAAAGHCLGAVYLPPAIVLRGRRSGRRGRASPRGISEPG